MIAGYSNDIMWVVRDIGVRQLHIGQELEVRRISVVGSLPILLHGQIRAFQLLIVSSKGSSALSTANDAALVHCVVFECARLTEPCRNF